MVSPQEYKTHWGLCIIQQGIPFQLFGLSHPSLHVFSYVYILIHGCSCSIFFLPVRDTHHVPYLSQKRPDPHYPHPHTLILNSWKLWSTSSIPECFCVLFYYLVRASQHDPDLGLKNHIPHCPLTPFKAADVNTATPSIHTRARLCAFLFFLLAPLTMSRTFGYSTSSS